MEIEVKHACDCSDLGDNCEIKVSFLNKYVTEDEAFIFGVFEYILKTVVWCEITFK